MSEQFWLFIIGTFIAVGSYFSKSFIFEPLLNFQKIKGKILNRLKYHSNIITNGEFPNEIVTPIRDELRQLSCDFEEAYYAIPFTQKLYGLYRIPSMEKMNDVASGLIFLSNATGSSRHIDKNYEMIQKIESILRIEKHD